MERPPPANPPFRSLGLIYQLVGEFVAPIVVGLAVDLLAKTGPWGTLVGAVLGCLVGGFRVTRLAAKLGNTGPGGPRQPDSGPQGGSP